MKNSNISSSAQFNICGNAMSLLYGDDFIGQTNLEGKDYCFNSLFKGNTNLISAENLILPATTLADWCYYMMFYGCTSLTTAPELPATKLADGCYTSMFTGCTSLTTAPELPATTLARYCYNSMFNDCTSLTTAPELPATTLASNCYIQMFQGCTSLTTAPELPATTLANYCYNQMFYGCSKLNYIKALFTTTPSSTYTYMWVKGVASNGTFVKNANATWDVTGNNGIPNGWTVQTITPSIINATFDDVTFYYINGLFTPSDKNIELTKAYIEEEILSFAPDCDIEVQILSTTLSTITSSYEWNYNKTLAEVMTELNIENVLDIAIVIRNVLKPENDGYGYYY